MRAVKNFLEKHLLIHYVIKAFLKALVISVAFFVMVFGFLKITGKYTIIESMLDLKYDSPWIIAPLIIATALAIVAFIVGMILYLYKYKRSSYKGDFYRSLVRVLGKNVKRG